MTEAPSCEDPLAGAVLLVEDETFIRKLAARALEKVGLKVVQASDGVEAMEIWRGRTEPFRLLLTDIVMPGLLSGRALAREIRREDTAIAIGLMSAHDPTLLTKGLETWERELPHLQKPFAIEELVEFVRRTLTQAAPPSQPTTGGEASRNL